MYKVALQIPDEDMRFLQERAPLYGKENAAEVLQLLMAVTLRSERLAADKTDAEGPYRGVAPRRVVLRIHEDEFRFAEIRAKRKGWSEPESELELLLSCAVNHAKSEGLEPLPKNSG
jgi:hypothetical protein